MTDNTYFYGMPESWKSKSCYDVQCIYISSTIRESYRNDNNYIVVVNLYKRLCTHPAPRPESRHQWYGPKYVVCTPPLQMVVGGIKVAIHTWLRVYHKKLCATFFKRATVHTTFFTRVSRLQSRRHLYDNFVQAWFQRVSSNKQLESIVYWTFICSMQHI